MGFLDRLRGRERRDPPAPAAARPPSADELALDRHRHFVRTAPPERVEQAHEEAFAALTPGQRHLALEQLRRQVPDERVRGDDPRSLARMATRAELRQPGTIERAFGRGAMGLGGSTGAGGLGLGAGLLGAFATAFAGTEAVQAATSERPHASPRA